jgi:anti-sigma factor RsiW
MNPCRRIVKQLSAYQDGEVGEFQKAAIESHLRSCRDCRRRCEALRRTYEALRRLPEIEVDDSLPQRIAAGVGDDRTGAFRLRVGGGLLRLLPVPATLAAVAVAGMLMGSVTGHFFVGQHRLPIRGAAAPVASPMLTLASLKAFDAVPPGSFAEDYLEMIAVQPEVRHAN